MAKFWAHGATVTFNATAIAGVQVIDLPALARGEFELTDMDSDGVREWEPGLVDMGEVTLEMLYDAEDTGQLALRDNLKDGDAAAEVVITVTESVTGVQTLTFDAFVTAFETSLSYDDEPATASCTLRVAGAPVTEGTVA